jgi:hypothetical protein
MFKKLQRFFRRATSKDAADDELRSQLNRPARDSELFAKGEDILLSPLAGWSSATLGQHNAVMIAIEYLREAPATEPGILRLAMTRAQAAELSKTLDLLARTPHVARPEKLT